MFLVFCSAVIYEMASRRYFYRLIGGYKPFRTYALPDKSPPGQKPSRTKALPDISPHCVLLSERTCMRNSGRPYPRAKIIANYWPAQQKRARSVYMENALRAYVREGLCPGGLMSGRAYDRKGLCPGGLMSERDFDRTLIFLPVSKTVSPIIPYIRLNLNFRKSYTP